jgi:hypothetical protein
MARILTFGFLMAMLGCASRERLQSSKALRSESHVPDGQVFVYHEVRAPGAYPWTNGMRLTDIIVVAGGLTDFAKRSRIFIIHSDGTREVHDYDGILKKKIADPLLRAGDFVHVYAPFL